MQFPGPVQFPWPEQFAFKEQSNLSQESPVHPWEQTQTFVPLQNPWEEQLFLSKHVKEPQSFPP